MKMKEIDENRSNDINLGFLVENFLEKRKNRINNPAKSPGSKSAFGRATKKYQKKGYSPQFLDLFKKVL